MTDFEFHSQILPTENFEYKTVKLLPCLEIAYWNVVWSKQMIMNHYTTALKSQLRSSQNQIPKVKNIDLGLK